MLMLILLDRHRHRPQTPEMQLVGRNREWGATISEILEGVNSLNNSDKKDDFVSLQYHCHCCYSYVSPSTPYTQLVNMSFDEALDLTADDFIFLSIVSRAVLFLSPHVAASDGILYQVYCIPGTVYASVVRYGTVCGKGWWVCVMCYAN